MFSELRRIKEQLDNLIKNANFGSGKKEDAKLTPQYNDGTFTYNIRKSGLMRYRFFYNGERVAVYGYSDQECYKKREYYISGKLIQKKKERKKYTVAEWALNYYNTFRRAKGKEATQRTHENYLNEIAAHFDKTKIENATAEQIQKFINNYNNMTNKRKKIFQFIRSAFEKAFKIGIIKNNPCELVEIDRHIYKGHPVIQFADQCKILKNIEIEKYKAAFMVYCCTGMRLNELLQSLPNIDFNNNIIRVAGGNSKTKKHTREIPFLPELITPQTCELLKQLNRNAIQSYFKKLFRRLNIQATIHSFRVTFISCCNHLSINILRIKQLAGHADITTTMNIYAKLLNHGTSPILEYLERLKNELKL